MNQNFILSVSVSGMDRTGVGVIWWLVLGWLASGEGEPEENHRQKRLVWITNDGRLALPPGTLLTITPTISLPFVRYPPDGFLSNMSISLPFTSEYGIRTYVFMLLILAAN